MWKIIKETWAEFRDDNAALMAAGMAYYTTFSIGPVLLIVLWAAGLVLGQAEAKQRVMAQAQQYTSPQAAGAVQTLVEAAGQRSSGTGIAAAIGIGLLIFGASRVFAQVQRALNHIWEVETPKRKMRGMVLKRAWTFVLVLGVGLLLLLSFLLSAVLSALARLVNRSLPFNLPLMQFLDPAVTLIVATLLFAAIYRFLPDKRIAWRDVWSGAFVSAVLFVVGKIAMAVYLGRSQMASAYGAVGSIIVLLLWIGYSAQIFFLGAEWTQVYARHKGSWRGVRLRGQPEV
jgi:membrane protein